MEKKKILSFLKSDNIVKKGSTSSAISWNA